MKGVSMKGSYLPLIALGLGLPLIGISMVWSQMVRNVAWTEAQAVERSEARAELHSLQGCDHNHGPDEPHDPEVEANIAKKKQAEERLAQADAEFERSQFFRLTVATALKWIGVAFSAAGVAGYFFFNRAA